MSLTKDQILEQIRDRFQRKFQHLPNLQSELDVHILNLSKKEKITKEDLDEIENKLQALAKQPMVIKKRSSSVAPRTTALEGLKTITSTINREDVIPSLPPSRRENQTISNRNPARVYRNAGKGLSETPGLCDKSLYYMSPMDLSILKKYDVVDTDKNIRSRRLNATFADDSICSIRASPRANKSFTIDQGSECKKRTVPYIRGDLPTYKMAEREKRLKEDIWNQIHKKSNQKLVQEDEQKNLSKQYAKSLWLNALNEQVQNKLKKYEDEKVKERQEGLMHIESDATFHAQHMKKEQEHKEYVNRCVKNNNTLNVEERMKLLRQKESDRRREIFEIQKILKTDQDSIDMEDKEKEEQKKKVKALKLDGFHIASTASLEKKKQEKEENQEAIKQWVEKENKDEARRQKNLLELKDRALNLDVSNNPTQRRGSSASGGYEKNMRATALLKFVYAEQHTDKWKKKVQKDLQRLNRQNEKQAYEKALRERNYKDHIDEQQTLWKHQDNQFETRENLQKEVEALKRIAQREALDEQIKNHSTVIKVQEAGNRTMAYYKTMLQDMKSDNRRRSVQS